MQNDFGGKAEDFISIASQPAVVAGIQKSASVLNLTVGSHSTAVFANDELPTVLDLAELISGPAG